MTWQPFAHGTSIGVVGTEAGTILRDDEHLEGARITLEENAKSAPYAITCGIYDWMAHTRFCGERTEAEEEYRKMKQALVAILAAIPAKAEMTDPAMRAVIRRLDQFVAEYP